MGLLRVGIATIALLATTCIVNAADALQVTALVGKDMKSTIECWTFTPDYLNVRGVRVLFTNLGCDSPYALPTDEGSAAWRSLEGNLRGDADRQRF